MNLSVRATVLATFLSTALCACGGGNSGIQPSPSPEPSVTPTVNPTPSFTPMASPTPSPDASPAPSVSPSPMVSPSPSAAPSPSPSPSPTVSPDAVVISGRITYDFVPHRIIEGVYRGLDYDNTSADPLRGATIALVDEVGAVINQSNTDADGNYTLAAPQETPVRTRILAELYREGAPAWNIRVTDNTNGNALYAVDGSLISSGSVDSIRDIHIPSGWTGTSYDEPRSAGPFAILDSVYLALQMLLAAEPDITLPPIELRWSIDNIAISGDQSQGEIGTSYFDGEAIYILGHEDNDTDEYDRSVVQHEFSHYLESAIFRKDTIGGPHSPTSKNDMRLAFSEGLGNAFAAMASGVDYYEDSGASRQRSGFRISLEEFETGVSGWYTSNSIGQILFDIFDDASESGDDLSLGYNPIHNVLTSDSLRFGNARVSIFSFAQIMREQNSAEIGDALNALLANQNIFGSDAYGTGETNDGGVPSVLPIYLSLTPGESVNFCISDTEGTGNSFDSRRLIRLQISNQANYNLSIDRTSGGISPNPAILIWQNDNLITFINQSAGTSESEIVNLTPGDYIFEVFDNNNLAACFSASVSIN